MAYVYTLFVILVIGYVIYESIIRTHHRQIDIHHTMK